MAEKLRDTLSKSRLPLSLILITKNEEAHIARAIQSVPVASEVIVVDSASSDRTVEIASALGAEIFRTQEWRGFGFQKNLALSKATQPWVLSLDADEWLTPELADELHRALSSNEWRDRYAGAVFKRSSIFVDRVMRWGDWRGDRVLRLFRRDLGRFSDDVVHERVQLAGEVVTFKKPLMHETMSSLEQARQKIKRYARDGASRLARRQRGGLLPAVLHASAKLLRGLIIRAGFLDGSRGWQLAWLNAQGTFLKYWWARHPHGDLKDHLNLFIVDHGVLRAIFDNRYRLAGGLYRCNQPSPRRLAFYKKALGIKSVINLRGVNHYQGWYRIEETACKALGLNLHNVKVFSRGLLDKDDLQALRDVIEQVELPAIVHCKSGADRAGFFSALFRHFRLGEPIEAAQQELSWKYGHLKQAKTGVLDYFLQRFVEDRRPRQSFSHWVSREMDHRSIEADFVPAGFSSVVVDRLLRRE
jgi:glycosyltransferase involved in cell wall biosynthesis